jgi:hypothetical protein
LRHGLQTEDIEELVVQVRLEWGFDPGKHEAGEQARGRTDGIPHRTALAKGEVGIRERQPAPTLGDFAEKDFLPFVRSTFTAKVKTLKYYEDGVKALTACEKLAGARLDAITTETIAG